MPRRGLREQGIQGGDIATVATHAIISFALMKFSANNVLLPLISAGLGFWAQKKKKELPLIGATIGAFFASQTSAEPPRLSLANPFSTGGGASVAKAPDRQDLIDFSQEIERQTAPHVPQNGQTITPPPVDPPHPLDPQIQDFTLRDQPLPNIPASFINTNRAGDILVFGKKIFFSSSLQASGIIARAIPVEVDSVGLFQQLSILRGDQPVILNPLDMSISVAEQAAQQALIADRIVQPPQLRPSDLIGVWWVPCATKLVEDEQFAMSVLDIVAKSGFVAAFVKLLSIPFWRMMQNDAFIKQMMVNLRPGIKNALEPEIERIGSLPISANAGIKIIGA